MISSDEAILSTAYLAPIQYYSKLIFFNKFFIEKHENYTKQTYRNRCAIYSANGKLFLSIPIVKNSREKTPITDIQIDYATSWQKNHWKSIESAYKSSPFFEFYIDDLIPFYKKRFQYLFDFNLSIQEIIIKMLQTDSKYSFTEEHIKSYSENILDYRDSIHPKISKNKSDSHFKAPVYNQVFINKFGFIPNLSIIDLLFNEGPNTLHLLKKSIC